MANKIVVVYQHVKISNKWTFKKVPATRRQFLSNGAYYTSWYQGTTKRMGVWVGKSRQIRPILICA